jgi:hypothetical protein
MSGIGWAIAAVYVIGWVLAVRWHARTLLGRVVERHQAQYDRDLLKHEDDRRRYPHLAACGGLDREKPTEPAPLGYADRREALLTACTVELAWPLHVPFAFAADRLRAPQEIEADLRRQVADARRQVEAAGLEWDVLAVAPKEGEQ